MELTEPTFPNLIAGIDKNMAPGVGIRMLIGTMRQGHMGSRTIQRSCCRVL